MKLTRLPSSLQRVPNTLRLAPHLNPDSWRSGKTTAQRGYGSRWQRASKRFLARSENVCCRMCEMIGVVTLATEVDHIEPHRGDQVLFWAEANWQGLCKPCHSMKTASE
jgi:5-methylcytosine-specific restriction endonuclease McrA